MENEKPNMPEQGGTKCDCGCACCGADGGKDCGVMCGKWSRKRWGKGGGGSAGCGGGLWAAGWLFAIGFLKLTFWKGIIALVLWPYYLGAFFAR